MDAEFLTVPEVATLLRVVALPPLGEQRALGKVVQCVVESADERSVAVAAKLEMLGMLNQSILAKAFRGELVPQDPNDEPSSRLLERIRAERKTSAMGPAPLVEGAAP